MVTYDVNSRNGDKTYNFLDVNVEQGSVTTFSKDSIVNCCLEFLQIGIGIDFLNIFNVWKII